jgi:1-acyl-sn-glycerol-3-phosphate acyltransferase
MAQLIELPRRPSTTGDDDALRASTGTVDEWGRDAQLLEQMSPLLRLRWNVSVGGLHHLPARAGALLVTNERRLSMSPLYVSWALSRASGRPIRFAGRPDSAPLGSALRRIGALLRDPQEVHGALRHGQVVLIGAGTTSHPRQAGAVDHQLIGAALTAGVAIIPVASMSSLFARAARAEVGAPVRERRSRRGPLADVEVAEAVQRHLQKMLDELGGAQTGVAPIDWLGEG